MDADYAKAYGDLYQRHWWWRARERFVLNTVRKIAKNSPQSILDIGCGSGWAFGQWEKFGVVEGLEIDPELVGRAGGRKHQIHLGPLDDTFQPGKQFSLIFMLDVLEHIQQPVEALVRIRDLLAPGGVVLITVPALPWLWTTHDVINHHYLRYTRRELRHTIESAGLRCKRLQYFFHWLVPMKLAVRLKEWISRPSTSLPAIPSGLWNQFYYGLSVCEQVGVSSWLPVVGTSLLAVVRK